MGERNNSYYFSRANQQKAGTKIYSLIQCSLIVNEGDWHILAGNDQRINLHCLTRYLAISKRLNKGFLDIIDYSAWFRQKIWKNFHMGFVLKKLESAAYFELLTRQIIRRLWFYHHVPHDSLCTALQYLVLDPAEVFLVFMVGPAQK